MKFTLSCVLSLFFGICFANHNEPDVVCSLPAESGMCYAYFPMFYYDAPSGKCINFIYGGCGGNNNRFWTEDECMNKCGGGGSTIKETVEEERGPIFLGPTDEGKRTTPQKPVDEGKEVIFQKPIDVGKGTAFPQPADGGRGTLFPHPADGGKGVIFHRPTFGGKGVIFQRPLGAGKGIVLQEPVDGGKGVLLQQPSDGVVLLHAPQSNICNQEKEAGNCSSQIIRYYFDKESRKCERFVYSGCGKNENSFDYKFECERTCPGEHDVGDICRFKQDTGPCRAFFPRFYFSSETGQCEQFIYGGCQGNHNNFKTKAECLRFCTSGKGSPLP